MQFLQNLLADPLWSDIAREWISSLRTDLARYVIFAVTVWLGLWVLLAGALGGRKIRDDRPPAKQLLIEFLASLRSIAVFSTVGLFLFLLERAGHLPGPKLAATWGPLWFGFCLVGMILAHDAYFYWVHRVMHHPRLFRVFHRRHHKSHNPSPFTAYSFDIGEAFVMASFVPLWGLIVPTPWGVTGVFMLHQIVRNTLGHSGYEIMPAGKDGRPLLDWMTSTTHHDLHHWNAGWNYGLYFTWWDRWMGTEHPEYHARFAKAVRKPLLEKGPRRGWLSAGVMITVFAFICTAPTVRADSHWSQIEAPAIYKPVQEALTSPLKGRTAWPNCAPRLWAGLSPGRSTSSTPSSSTDR